jgi:hypothetical protein
MEGNLIIMTIDNRSFDYFQYVIKGEGIKYSFNIMKTIASFADNIQAKVDLTIGEANH